MRGKRIESDLNPIFEVGELLYEQFIFKESYTSDINIRKCLVTCTACGKDVVFKEADLIKSKPTCKSCREIKYNKTVELAESISHRVCRGCKKLLPKEEFRERIGCKNYINPWCKKCEIKKFKYPENLMNEETGLKRCALCKELLPRKRFSKHPHNPDGLKSWCDKCNQKHYRESLVKRGLKPPPLPEETLLKRSAAREIKNLSKEERKKQWEIFKVAREAFYKDPLNKGKRYLFVFWQKGYYN